MIQSVSTPQIHLFLDPPSENLSPCSKNAYRTDREAYLAFCTTEGISIGDTTSLEAYKGHLEASSLKPATINRKLCGIKKGLVGYLVAIGGRDKEEIARQLYRSVHQIRISKGEKSVRPESILTDEEIEKLIRRADPRTALIIRFLSKTGCRVSELVGITVADVRVLDGAVEVSVMGKGHKARTVYISLEDLDAIRTTIDGKKYLFETIHGNQYDRTSITKNLGSLSRRVLGKHLYAHLLRHSFATKMIAKTRKIQAVSEYLGHADVATTLSMYTHETLTLGELL